MGESSRMRACGGFPVKFNHTAANEKSLRLPVPLSQSTTAYTLPPPPPPLVDVRKKNEKHMKALFGGENQFTKNQSTVHFCSSWCWLNTSRRRGRSNRPRKRPLGFGLGDERGSNRTLPMADEGANGQHNAPPLMMTTNSTQEEERWYI